MTDNPLIELVDKKRDELGNVFNEAILEIIQALRTTEEKPKPETEFKVGDKVKYTGSLYVHIDIGTVEAVHQSLNDKQLYYVDFYNDAIDEVENLSCTAKDLVLVQSFKIGDEVIYVGADYSGVYTGKIIAAGPGGGWMVRFFNVAEQNWEELFCASEELAPYTYKYHIGDKVSYHQSKEPAWTVVSAKILAKIPMYYILHDNGELGMSAENLLHLPEPEEIDVLVPFKIIKKEDQDGEWFLVHNHCTPISVGILKGFDQAGSPEAILSAWGAEKV